MHIEQSNLLYVSCMFPSVLEDSCDLPIRHGRVHQDIRQVPQEILARRGREGVLPLREHQERLLRSLAGTKYAAIYTIHSHRIVVHCDDLNILQEFEKQYPDANVLLVTVTDEESRRIEQQPDSQTKAEIMEVVRSMFPDEDVPDATDILVPRWWSDRFFRGSFSNWPIGVSRYEYDQLRVRTTTPTKC